MTLNQQGNKGPKGYQSGDLIIFFEENLHSFFTRNGDDIFTEIKIQEVNKNIDKNLFDINYN